MKYRIGIACLILLCAMGYARAAEITFAWDKAAGADSYSLKCGTAAGGPYTSITKDFGDVAQGVVTLPDNVDRWCIATAWVSTDRPGTESTPSNEVKVHTTAQVPAPGNLRQVITTTLYQDGTLETTVVTYEDSKPIKRLSLGQIR